MTVETMLDWGLTEAETQRFLESFKITALRINEERRQYSQNIFEKELEKILTNFINAPLNSKRMTYFDRLYWDSFLSEEKMLGLGFDTYEVSKLITALKKKFEVMKKKNLNITPKDFTQLVLSANEPNLENKIYSKSYCNTFLSIERWLKSIYPMACKEDIEEAINETFFRFLMRLIITKNNPDIKYGYLENNVRDVEYAEIRPSKGVKYCYSAPTKNIVALKKRIMDGCKITISAVEHPEKLYYGKLTTFIFYGAKGRLRDTLIRKGQIRNPRQGQSLAIVPLDGLIIIKDPELNRESSLILESNIEHLTYKLIPSVSKRDLDIYLENRIDGYLIREIAEARQISIHIVNRALLKVRTKIRELGQAVIN